MAHLPPLQGAAQLISEEASIQHACEERPSHHQLDLARRRQLQGEARAQPQAATAQAWTEFVLEKVASNAQRENGQFRYYTLVRQADWVPAAFLLAKEEETTPAEGACLLMSVNQEEHLKLVLARHRGAGVPLVVLGDFTFKVTVDKWALGTISVAHKHLDVQTRLPASQAVPIAHIWAPSESQGLRIS
eukprot:s179_g41.t1